MDKCVIVFLGFLFFFLLLAKEQPLPLSVQHLVQKGQEKNPSELQQQALCNTEIITGHNRASGHSGMGQDCSQQAI